MNKIIKKNNKNQTKTKQNIIMKSTSIYIPYKNVVASNGLVFTNLLQVFKSRLAGVE